MRNSRALGWLFVSLVAATAAGAGAHPPHRAKSPVASKRRSYDAASGRDLLNYPPHRAVDIRHTRLEIVIADMNTPAMTVRQLVRISPISGSVTSFPLNAAGLNIRTASATDRKVTVKANPGDEHIEVVLEPALEPDQIVDLVFEFEVNDAAEGVVWTPESPAWPGRAASLHTQGEPESNRHWMIGHDYPNERLTSEVVVTVPAGYTAVSNGREEPRERVSIPATGAAAERFRFVQDKEHAPYLISLAVGKYDVVDVGGSKLPMPVYAPEGQGGRVRAVFGRTRKMVELYERLFDEPYPWAKYAQVVVTNFAWGGMENTSATSLYDSVALDPIALEDGDEDGLICHELAHQWFGDLITCKSWEHIWLNEGWATYCEALWEQYRLSSLGGRGTGDPTGSLRADEDAYQYAIWRNFADVIAEDEARAPFQPAMVSREFSHPDQVFLRAANPYPKGSAALHMMRRAMGDRTFFRAAAGYVDACRNQAVETQQFRREMERVSGLSLQRFVDQWCYRPGVPKIEVTPTWNAAERTLTLSVRQLQNIDGANPAFWFTLPVWISDGARVVTTSREIETTEATWTVELEAEPTMVVVDPSMDVLADVMVVQPVARTIAQLRSGPTLASRLNAARSLGGGANAEGVAALAEIAKDARTHHGLRRECLSALGRLANPPGTDQAATSGEGGALAALRAMNAGHFREPRVRKEWIAQLSHACEKADADSKRDVCLILKSRWEAEKSYDVRAECLKGLGALKSVDGMGVLEAGLQTPSQHDQIRQGALHGIAAAEFPDALENVLPLTTPGFAPETRQAAIRAAAQLASRDPERVLNVFTAVANTADLRTRRVALEALIEMDDPRGRLQVEQFAAGTGSRSDRVWAEELLRAHTRDSQSSARP